jgi:hypothetical protein
MATMAAPTHFRLRARRTVTLPARISARESELALEALLVDVGLDGACVELGMPVEAGDRVRLSVDLPGLWDPLTLDAVVAWTATGPEQRARAGVQFTSPPGSSLLLLAELVERT